MPDNPSARWRTASGLGSLLTPGSPLRRVVEGALGSVGFKVTGAGLQYLVALVLARMLGATGYGAYAFALAWVQLLLIPALFGMERLAVREVARAGAVQDWAMLRSVVLFAAGAALTVAVAICAALQLVLALAPDWLGVELSAPLRVGIWLLPLLALIRVLMGAVRGLHRVLLAQVPELTVLPLTFLVVVSLVAWLAGAAPGVSAILGLQIAAAAVTLLVALLTWLNVRPVRLGDAPVTFAAGRWLTSALPFMLIGSAHVINLQLDRVMLGGLANAETVGVYTIAVRNAGLIDLFLLAVNMALAPFIADRYAKGDLHELQGVVTSVARLVLACAIPAVLVMIFLGPFLLGLFGAGFVVGYHVLIVLALGKFSIVLAGTGGIILTMTGHERRAARAVAVSVVLNFVLNLALIPHYGMMGAAAATVLSSLVWQIWLTAQAIRHVAIDPTPAGWFRRPAR